MNGVYTKMMGQHKKNTIIMKAHLKNSITLFLFLLSLYSCKKEEPQINYKLKNFKSILLHFDELDYGYYPSISPIVINYNSQFSNKISLQYNNLNQITNTLGGLSVTAASTNINTVCLSNDVVDKIQYSENYVTTEIEYPYKTYTDTTKYLLKNGKLVERIVIKNNPYYMLDYTYQYNGDKIIETLNGVLQTSIIYFSNNNATKFECFIYNSSKEITYKTEIIFSDYDQSINLLKGFYYIHGAFYNAFSTNNYKKRQVNTYSCSNNQYTQISSSIVSINYTVNSNNIPDLFEYEIY